MGVDLRFVGCNTDCCDECFNIVQADGERVCDSILAFLLRTEEDLAAVCIGVAVCRCADGNPGGLSGVGYIGDGGDLVHEVRVGHFVAFRLMPHHWEFVTRLVCQAAWRTSVVVTSKVPTISAG